jgi:hypothetical protein
MRMTSDQKLESEITELKDLGRKCFNGRQRFAFYRYLVAVYSLYDRLRRKQAAKQGARNIQSMCGMPPSRTRHPIRIILDATSSADAKTKSRWTRALRFARHERRRWQDLESFLRRNGGPAGCADQFAALHAKASNRMMTFSTPGYRVPVLVEWSV